MTDKLLIDGSVSQTKFKQNTILAWRGFAVWHC